MKQEIKEIKIKDCKIPIEIKNYNTSKRMKIYFKDGKIILSKPKKVKLEKAIQFMQQEEEKIYEQYLKILEQPYGCKKWENGEQFFYQGEPYEIQTEITENKRIKINIQKGKRKIQIQVPMNLTENSKEKIDEKMKKELKIKTHELLEEKLPYWSKKTRNTVSIFSCN